MNYSKLGDFLRISSTHFLANQSRMQYFYVTKMLDFILLSLTPRRISAFHIRSAYQFSNTEEDLRGTVAHK